jgi:hypothetical protein
MGLDWRLSVGRNRRVDVSGPRKESGRMHRLIDLRRGDLIWVTRRFAPWHHPTTPYWRLYLVLYLLFLLTIPWAIWAFGGLGNEQVNSWMLLWLLPMLTPIFINARKTWSEGEPGTPQDD